MVIVDEDVNDLDKPVGWRTEEDRLCSPVLVEGRRAKMAFLSLEFSRTLCVLGVMGDGFRLGNRAEARVVGSSFEELRPNPLL
jgi:hypothetical protein